MTSRIAIAQNAAEPSSAELNLQSLLGCRLVRPEEASPIENEVDFILRWQEAALFLFSTAVDAPGGLKIDFSAPALQSRALDGLRRQGLGKAVGLKNKPLPTVLDATAGLGNDAYLLASAGCDVQLLERSAVVYAMLADALARAATGPALVDAVVSRMRLQHADFLDAPLSDDSFDVVYLDPMFPADRKSAKSGKGMYLLQELLGYDCDEQALLGRAIKIARKRVVVKRAKLSPQLAGAQPDICYRGSSSRFDVYLKPQTRKSTAGD